MQLNAVILNIANVSHCQIQRTKTGKSDADGLWQQSNKIWTGHHFQLTVNNSFNWRFSHDVMKVQTIKLLILLRLYFHDIYEQLKTTIHTNVLSERSLGFVIEYVRISKSLRATPFTGLDYQH